jgi:hypothetical protein
MRTFGKSVVLLFFTVIFLSGVVIVQAQDETSGAINCDSDLLLNLAIAERFFGYDTLREQQTSEADEPTSIFDLNIFNRGQFGTIHETQESVRDPNNPDYGILTEQQFNNVSSAVAQDDDSFDADFNATHGFDPTTGTTLSGATVADEATECNSLRLQLNRFFRAVLSEDVSSGRMIGQGARDSADVEATSEASDTSMDATPEATPSS